MANTTVRNRRKEVASSTRAAKRRMIKLVNGQYGVLLSRLQSQGLGSSSEFRTLGFISTNRREGVTTVAASFALLAATCQDWRVLLVDTNLATPGLHRVFMLEDAPGLAELLGGQATESECIQDLTTRPVKSWLPRRFLWRFNGLSRILDVSKDSDSVPQLSLLTAGTARRVSREVCRIPDDEFIYHVASQFDLVVFDLPAINSAASGLLPLDSLDGIVVVLEAEVTSETAARKGLARIREQGASVVGAVLNKSRTHLPKWIDRRLGD